MSLAIVVLILIFWAIIGIKNKLTPSAPPIENLDLYLRQMSQYDTQRERRRFAIKEAKRRIKNQKYK